MKTLIPDEAAIFNTARHMKGAEERRLYLDGACEGDERLRTRIESLLRVHDLQPSFLETPATEVPPRIASSVPTDRIGREGPGTQIGAYKLVDQIGEGGFGLVFVAEQEQPVRRKVALKIIKPGIKPGMDSRQVITTL